MIDDLLASIAAGHLRPSQVVIVVDRNPALSAALRGASWPLAVTVMDSTGAGLAAARNTGWRATKADLVAFIDDDGVASPGWLDELATALTRHRAGVVGGAIEPRWMHGEPAWYSSRLGWVVGCTYEGLPTVPSAVRNVIGCNMMIRRPLLEALGGFNSTLGRSGRSLDGSEETEFCIRANAIGDVVFFVPGATVFQVLPPSRAAFRYVLRRAWSEGRSKRRLVALHGQVLGVEMGYAKRIVRDAAGAVLRAVIDRRSRDLVRAISPMIVLATTGVSYLAYGVADSWRASADRRRGRDGSQPRGRALDEAAPAGEP